MVFQLVGKISIFRGEMLGTPRETIILLPFTLERFAISGICPKFRLFKEDFTNARIDDRLDLCFLEILEVVKGRHNVWSARIVQDGIPLHVLLTFVHVRFSVPFPQKVVTISTPCDTGHEMGGVSTLAPTSYAFLETHLRTVAGTIYHNGIGTDINGRFPMAGRLESGLYFLCHTRTDKSKQGNGCYYLFHVLNILS